MYDIEKAKQYAWEQADWIAHSNGYFLMKDCVFFYHKGNVVFDPWNDVDGNAVDDPFSFYGKDKMDEFCRRILAKKEGATPSRMISVDSKILDFLKMLYFGVTDNPFEAASRSAYTDMCRTIRFNGKNGDMLRKAVDALLEERIPELVGALRFLCIFRNVPGLAGKERTNHTPMSAVISNAAFRHIPFFRYFSN